MNINSANHPLQPMTMYFDGACPLCAAEIHLLRARNRRGLLQFIDLSQAVAAAQQCEVVCAQALENIHGVMADGSTLVGVPVFAEAYRRADLPLMAWLFSRPWLRWPLDGGYAWFARHRARISALIGPLLLRLVRWHYRSGVRAGPSRQRRV